MKEYYFFFNDNNELQCQITDLGKQFKISGQEAIEKLISINRVHFNNVRASNRLIKLNSNDLSVIISDLDDFYKYRYSKYIPDIMNNVKKAIEKRQKRKHKDKQIKNLKVFSGQVACGALIFTLIGTAANAIYKELDKDDNSNTYAIENEISVEPIYVEKANLDETTNLEVNSNDIDEMIKELDEETIVKQENQIVNIADNEIDVKQENRIVNITDGELDERQENQVINTVNREPKVEQEEQIDNSIDEKDIDTAYLDYEDQTNGITYTGAYEMQYDRAEKHGLRWGMSTNLVLGMITQESAGKGDNLMHVIFDAWLDQPLTAYDFENQKYQTIVLTDEPQKFAGEDITTISREDLNNVDIHLDVACIIYRYCLDRMENNIPAAIQAFNIGCEGMNTVFRETSAHTGISFDELKSDPTNVEFMNYTDCIDWGDHEYLKNVARYIGDEPISIKVLNEDGEIEYIELNIAQKTL